MDFLARGGGYLSPTRQSEGDQQFVDGLSLLSPSLVNRRHSPMAALRVCIGVRHFAELLEGLVVTASTVEGGAQRILFVGRERIELQGALHFGDSFVESSERAEDVSVVLVSHGVIRVELNGALKFLFLGGPFKTHYAGQRNVGFR